ncbi:MAG: hypothetical protein D8H97_23550 [Neisseria sp.]|nr:MAG: hypothetical protein D8H97_23550 [Neisseria sp.]
MNEFLENQSIPQLYIGEQSHSGFVNAADMLNLPSSTPFGNLCLKYMKILQTMSYINEKLVLIFLEDINIRTNRSFIKFSYLISIEEVVFLLRRITDEIIALLWLLGEWVKSGQCPTKLSIDCIGSALNNKEILSNYLLDYEKFLDDLNHISNAQKHSFINSDLNLIGYDEPVINALRLDRNNLKNFDIQNWEKNHYSISVRYLIKTFNALFNDMKMNIEHLNSQLKINSKR